MPKGDREPMPTDLALCECGHVITPHPGLLFVKHAVHHAEWLTPAVPAMAVPLVECLRALAVEYEADRDRLNRRLVDRDLEIDSLNYDLNVAHDLIHDLRAELDAVLGDRHMST